MAGLLLAAIHGLALAQATAPGDAKPADQVPAAPPVLRAIWAEADHPSGVYHVKAGATLQVLVENPSDEPQSLEGSIAFGEASKAAADFKPLSLTPIAATTLAAHERVKVPLSVTFGAAGGYELHWIHPDKSSTPIESPAGVTLHAIFARIAAGTGTAEAGDSPWITTLPRPAALVPGYIADLAGQTAVHRFLLDERFAFDPATNIALGFGASLNVSADQVRDLRRK